MIWGDSNYVYWSSPSHSLIEWREWAGEYAIYNGADDSVHYLDAVQGLVLSTVLSSGQPMSFDQLAGRIMESCVADTTVEEICSLLVDLLPQLHRLGLVEKHIKL